MMQPDRLLALLFGRIFSRGLHIRCSQHFRILLPHPPSAPSATFMYSFPANLGYLFTPFSSLLSRRHIWAPLS